MSEADDVITRLYTAFSKRDHEGMAACYADDATFSDPVFRGLKGIQVKGMWRMLCERGEDLKIELRDVKIDGDKATAHWEADYTFSKTKRKVHNVIDARFTLKDGKIVAHEDSFDLWKWTSMALGAKGMLLGWSPVVKNAVRAEAMKGLELFMKRKRMS
jgi:ketosteroid isomerase-like protein